MGDVIGGGRSVAPVIAVTGTKREGGVLRQGGVTLVAGGGGATSILATKLAQLVEGAAGIVSFGMAGALETGLELGNLVIGDRLSGTFETECDPRWLRALSARLPGARIGGVYADGRMIADPLEKQSLCRAHDAVAVDMESHIAAEAAARAGLPFAIVRCISDEAEAALPPAIAVAMRPSGGLALGAMFVSIVAQPGQLPALIRSTANFRQAYAALKRGARAAGPRVAFDLR